MIMTSLWQICLSASSAFEVTVGVNWGQYLVRVIVMVKVRVKVRFRIQKY